MGDGLIRLGRRIEDEQDAALARRLPDPHGRERFVAAALALRPAPRRRVIKVAAGALAFAAVVAALVLFVSARRPLRFWVESGDGTYAGAAGAWIATPPDHGVPVRFSDGTNLQIEPNSKLRVASVDAEGGRVVLESGALHAAVVHRERTRWVVDSGPFAVRVTGTRFDVRWDLVAEQLTVALEEGSVVVSGPIIGEGIAVRAGDTLRVDRKAARFELQHGASEAPAAPPSTASPVVIAPHDEPAAPAPPAATARVHAPPVKAAAPRRTWRELAAAGKYQEALAAADHEGFLGICDEGSAADLRDLGDAARLSGDAARAVVALTTLRRRFPGSDQAAEAAFLLGVLAFGRADGDAGHWFAAYLDEQPRGRLAREAAGRLIEARVRAGDDAGAREAARRYLRQHPGGPHAEMARGLVGE